MSFLAQCRLSPRWLVLLVGLAALAVMTAALVPHDDGKVEDQDCLVCKAGHQPLTQLTVELVSEPPVDFTSTTPAYRAALAPTDVVESGAPRAPPV